jgi:hypothetical protein
MGGPLNSWASLETLQENSPFIPPDYKPRGGNKMAKPSSGTSSRGLELTGMIQIGESWSFSFYEPSKKRSFWVKMGDAANEIQVVDMNLNQKTVTIEVDGAKDVIKLKEPKLTGAAGSGKGPVLAGAAIGGQSNPNAAKGKFKEPMNKPANLPPPILEDMPPLTAEDEAALQLLEKILSGLGPQDMPPLPAP